MVAVNWAQNDFPLDAKWSARRTSACVSVRWRAMHKLKVSLLHVQHQLPTSHRTSNRDPRCHLSTPPSPYRPHCRSFQNSFATHTCLIDCYDSIPSVNLVENTELEGLLQHSEEAISKSLQVRVSPLLTFSHFLLFFSSSSQFLKSLS